MKRLSAIAALAFALRLTTWAAAAASGEGFLPLTPDGYPLLTTNPVAPTAPASAPATAVAVPAAVLPSISETNTIVLDDSHKLVPGDKLSFQIMEDRHIPNLDNTRPTTTSTEQSKALIVADTGELDVPYVGRVNVSGKTCKDVAAELKVSLEKDYYYHATVVLGLDQMSRVLGRVYVWGEVRNQGAVEIPANENLTASKAILRAGGFNDWAKKSKVKIIRAGKAEGGTKQEIYVDMEAVLQEGHTEKDVPLQPDDFIIVPRSKINF